MKRSGLLLMLLFLFTYGFPQTIHSTGEILKIMSDSKLSYEIKILDSTINCKDYSDKVNYHDCYRVTTDSGLYTYKFSYNDQSQPLFDKAETFFQSKNLDSALVYYKSSLIADSSLYNVMTYIGQIYGSKGNYKDAIEWYKKAIQHNYIDYMAHWFLADTYLATKDLNSALEEIVIAQILNRNNQRIKKAVTNILDKNKRSTEDWCFNPQIELGRISDNKISVSLKDNWTGYAMAKALWTYEPGYRESMGVASGQYSTLEDKECLISLLTGIENAKIKIKNDPQLQILKNAADNKYLEEYILYEIVLPQAPFVAYQLPEQTIQQIKDYIINIRNTK
jgi:tetratricopeptide (TPR) repeat protein